MFFDMFLSNFMVCFEWLLMVSFIEKSNRRKKNKCIVMNGHRRIGAKKQNFYADLWLNTNSSECFTDMFFLFFFSAWFI